MISYLDEPLDVCHKRDRHKEQEEPRIQAVPESWNEVRGN